MTPTRFKRVTCKRFSLSILLTFLLSFSLATSGSTRLSRQEDGLAGREPSAFADAHGLANSKTLYVPHLKSGKGWQTTIILSNLEASVVDVSVEAYDKDGSFIGEIGAIASIEAGETKTINAKALPKGAQSLRIESNGDLMGHMIFKRMDGRKSEVVPAINEASQQLDFPTLVSGDTFYKTITLLNPNPEPAEIEVVAIDASGYEIERSALTPLAPMESRTLFLTNIFDSTTLENVSVVRVVSDSNVIGLQLVDYPEGDLVGLPALTSRSRGWTFPIIIQGEDLELWTEVGILNPGDTTASIAVEALDASDNSLGIIETTSLAPGTIYSLGTESIQGTIPSNARFLRVTADQPITGYELIGVVNGSGVTAAMGIAEEDPTIAGLEITGSNDGRVLNAYQAVRLADGHIRPSNGSIGSLEWQTESRTFEAASISQSLAVSIPTLRWSLSGTRSDRQVLAAFGANWAWRSCGGVPEKHAGVDLAATPGEDVYASEAGIVRAVFNASSNPTLNWGKGVTIDHSGFTAVYLHVDPLVSAGQSVSKGQKIATIHNMDTPHLHFGVRNSSYSNTSNRGALPQRNSTENSICQYDPLFPENFVDPMTLTYQAGGCSVTPINMGQAVNGTLSTSDCRSPVRGGSYYADRYSFSASAGQQVAISLTSSAFDTYLYLVGPSGSVIAQDDDGGGGTNSRIPAGSGSYSLPSSGTYIIEVTSYSANSTGNYALSLTQSTGSIPTAPSNLSATAVSLSQINLTWLDNSNNETEFRIERKAGVSGTWGQIATAGTNATGYSNTGLSTNTTYFYRVRACNSAGCSGYSNESSAITGGTPPGPFTLTATPECNGTTPQVRLNWTGSSGATSYDVYRNGSLFASGLTATQYVNTGVSAGASYTYYVQARNSAGSSNSNSVSATAPSNCGISPPGSFTLAATAECSSNSPQIRLNWTSSSGATSYDLYRNGGLYYSGLTGTQFINTAVTAGMNYTYFVQARNSAGSTNSNTVSATAPTNCVPPISWEFNVNGNLEGWAPTNATASVSSGILYMNPSGIDPYLSGPIISASAASYNYVRLRMASNAIDGGGAIYFRTQAENFYSEDKKVTFSVNNCSLCGNAAWYEYTIYMRSHPKWTGTITGIRLDPANSGRGGTDRDAIGIDYIRLVP